VNATLLDRLRAALGAARVLALADDVAPYTTDWRGRYQGHPLCVVCPASTEEVATVVRLCAEAGVAMVPQGGNTGLCGGATPIGGEVIIHLDRLNRIRDIDRDNSTMTVEAGCTLRQVQDAAASVERLFPLSLAAEGSATIGGNLSTNAGGVQVLRYGNARDLTLGLEVVLPDGRVWDGLRGLRKDNTGYDLKHLFIGAEGTLGLITAAVLKLFPQPRATATAWVAVPDPASAVALLGQLRAQCGDSVTAFEIVGGSALALVLKHVPNTRDPLAPSQDWKLLIELADSREIELAEPLLACLAAARAQGIVTDAVVAQNLSEAASFWALREHISEAQRREGVSIKHDIALPLSRIDQFVRAADAALQASFPGVRIVCFGHIGDGNLHYNVSHPQNENFVVNSASVNRIVHDLANSLGGSISAEHGLGQLKRTEILRYKSEVEMSMMRAVKQALDPRGLMNQGKVV
jgi:FAD/FMN-containing dehydrogenase